jgi:hypothetical protein
VIFLLFAAAVVTHGGAAKLIIIPPGQPATVVDYASMEKCERARAVFERAAEEAKANGQQTAQATGRPVIVKTILAYCIPA